MGVQKDLTLPDLIRARMDRQVELDMNMMKRSSNVCRIANMSYRSAELVSKNILRDDLAIDDLKTGLRKVDDRLYDLLHSDTLKAAEAYAKENLQESKWTSKLSAMEGEIEAKTGKSVGNLKKQYGYV
ncbi:Oidioi.mRNA.OKI2018_I69.chr1.g823.t1.cds [Oikopleura dioica]|uniref:Oidioi.mRNA.OKI2018_I69.chr1.g823.t1.cds n=1 Tax=Oikopleura dioica TaxID=34765 RepID=A0ABN7SMT2_OIKDI|nr:Oidioi.mRNA.OKI2018_I69.chr1.g823.t1.cds [Oikopleura dioica]